MGKISSTRQTWCLPSVPKTTLGNNKTHGITVYAECLHSANNRHTATSCPGNTVDLRYHFAECHTLTHGKPTYMPSVKIRHSANPHLYRVSPSDTRQILLYAECQHMTLGKQFFFDFAPQTFCNVVLQYMLLCVEVLYISELFYYISSIYLVKWIFGNFLDLNCKCFEYPKKVNKKMIFLSLSLFWDRIQGQTRNFEHCVRETWAETRGGNVWKFYKKQTKSENHEIHRVVMISYVEAMVKNWECFGKVDTYAAYKSDHLRRRFWDLRKIR